MRTFTVLRFDFWAGRLSLTYPARKNGKSYRDSTRTEKIICGRFNYSVCLLLGHEQCTIPGCDCGICFHCGKKMKAMERKV